MSALPAGKYLLACLKKVFWGRSYTYRSKPTSIVYFADDTTFLSIHRDIAVASQRLQSLVNELENWLLKSKINVNRSNFMHIAFALRKGNCSPIKINSVTITEHNSVRYLGIHLDHRLS